MSNVMMNEDTKIFNLATQNLNFSIDASNREELCFAENLLICAKTELSSDTKSVGGYCISIEKIGPESREFLISVGASMEVHLESSYSSAGGSRLVGSVNENLQCLEEKRTEFLHRNDGKYEKCLYIGSEDDHYHIEVGSTCPCNSSSFNSDCDIPMKNQPRFISEGGNILLTRYLALTNYHGSLTLESMTIDGIIETCDYRCTSAEWKKLDGRRLEVYSVERRRRRQENEENVNNEIDHKYEESKTLLTKRGKILRHEWLGLPYLLRINPLIDPLTIDSQICANLPRRPLKEIWPDYLELMSKYLDKKSCGIVRQTNYFTDHPEIKNLVADYTQVLLIVRPLDVIDFTIQHFKAFGKHPEE